MLVLMGADWPLPLPEDAELLREDIDGDGFLEERWTTLAGGTGWRQLTSCLRHGASGHIACDEDHTTAYALFSGWRRTLQPAMDNRAAPLLAGRPCIPPDPLDPTQGAMHALLLDAPLEGIFSPNLRWLPGAPVPQRSVCLSPASAAAYPSGLTWTGEGAAPAPESRWKVWYGASWPSWTQGGRSHSPQKLPLTLGALEVYQHGHALAVHDRLQERHAWIINLGAGGEEGFKVDRWERIRAVTAPDARSLQVQVARQGGPDTLVRIALPVPDSRRDWSTLGLRSDRPMGAVQVLDLDGKGQRCLLEGTLIDHIYRNGAVLALSEDGGWTWRAAPAAEEIDGTFAALAADATGQRLVMLRHRQIAGMYPLLLHSEDGGKTWREDAAFSQLYWDLAPGSVQQAEHLAMGEDGQVALWLMGQWLVRSAEGGSWGLQSAVPAWLSGRLPAPQVPQATARCAARLGEQYVVLGQGEQGEVELHARE